MKKNVTKIFLTSMLCLTLAGCNFTKTPTVTNGKANDKVQEIDNDQYVKYDEEGVRINTSPKIINNTQKLDDIEFNISSLEEVANMTTITLNAKNVSEFESVERRVVISLYDKKGNNTLKQNLTVPSLLPNESINIKIQATLDFANAYEYKITEN